MSVGDGCTIAGTWKGLREMHALGLLPRLPRMLGVQAEGARPLVDAFEREARPRARRRRRRWPTASASAIQGTGARRLRAVRESRGRMVAVPDDAILEAMRAAGRRAGVFGEPAGVAGLAGLRLAVERGIVSPRERALAVVTGSGLKDVRSAMRAAGEPVTLPADDEQLDAYLRERPL